jgi:hypothetical protein
VITDEDEDLFLTINAVLQRPNGIWCSSNLGSRF